MTRQGLDGDLALRADVRRDDRAEVVGQVHDRTDRDVQARLRTLRLAVEDTAAGVGVASAVSVELVGVDARVELPLHPLLVEVVLDLGVAADAWSGGADVAMSPTSTTPGRRSDISGVVRRHLRHVRPGRGA